jgi:hypothetical protein
MNGMREGEGGGIGRERESMAERCVRGTRHSVRKEEEGIYNLY